MTLFEVVLKATHDHSFLNLTRRFPSVKMFIWCNLEHDVIEAIVGNPENFELVVDEIKASGIPGIIDESSDNQRIHMVVHECSCMMEDTIICHIGDLDLLHVFPTILDRGWEFHRIITFRHADLEELLKRLEDAGWTLEILRKVPFDGFIVTSLTLSADTLLSDLTDKQIEALLTAHRYGYYNLPRKADVQTIAAKQRIPRTTFQEHLKKAENKLVSALVPYIQLFNQAPIEKKQSIKMP